MGHAKRIAVVDNTKLKDMDKKKHIQSLCPVNRAGKECMLFSGQKLLIDENLCIGCGICVNQDPDAIKVINLPEALDKPPLFRYGENQFALYSIPIPQPGKVVGILGRNGIGKSTAVQILSGLIKPNFGETDKEVSYDEIIKFFRGTEAQGFFERMRDGKVTVAYKPQHVDMIPRKTKGTVRELLEKVDEKEAMDKMAEELGISGILDRDVSQISGGELQRVAIAATVLKKANVYIFDEPSSYLDIKQRIRMAKFLRSLADEDTAVLVVEHDLIMLDYMTDLIHIMYGHEGVFGIVSLPKTTRVGMNVYLHGYLKEENVRFRDSKIQFIEKAPSRRQASSFLVSWKGISKDLEGFSLEAPEGKLPNSEVVGILGENGIGKTTFIKILAQELKQDSGELDRQIKISYKPQYLIPSEDLVMTVLQDAIKKQKNLLINPLNIEPLFLRRLDQLSGGELQRVAIARCLSQDAELYLLDEPSAYLDAEQRLLVSKVIRDFAETRDSTVLVVDHDLLFIDYLADMLMIFDGEPSKRGKAGPPVTMESGMNAFLRDLEITLRRDQESHRPRINKERSQKDQEQKATGKLYYA